MIKASGSHIYGTLGFLVLHMFMYAETDHLLAVQRNKEFLVHVDHC